MCGYVAVSDECLQESERIALLSFCSGHERQDDADGFGAFGRAIAKADLPKDDRQA